MRKKHPHITARTLQSIAFGTLCVLGAFAIGIETVGDVHPFTHSEAAVQETTSATPLRGDANGNGILDLEDVTIILEASQGLSQPSPDQIRRGDTDGDFQLTVKDALRVLHQLSR